MCPDNSRECIDFGWHPGVFIFGHKYPIDKGFVPLRVKKKNS